MASDSPDLLADIDAGIARHQSDDIVRPNGKSWCGECLRWTVGPCETLKALQGWREAVVEGGRLRALVTFWENGAAASEHRVRAFGAKLEAAEAKLKDAEGAWKREAEDWQRGVREFGRSMDPDHAHHEVRDWLNDAFAAGKKDAEEKMRGLREALENAWDRMDRARSVLTSSLVAGAQGNWGVLDTKLDREALTQAKREGE